MGKVITLGLATILLGPTALVLSIGVLLNPAAQASCMTPATSTATVGAVPETSRVAFPLPAGTWVRTSGFGMRRHPVTGEYKLHTGVDYAADEGTPILAAADGVVTSAGPAAGYGHLVLIEHTVGGVRVATGYAHMYAGGLRVSVGDVVTAGQQIAEVGSDGYSTGAHLHFEVRAGGASGEPIDPQPWLAGHGAVEVAGSTGEPGFVCGHAGGPAAPYVGDDPDQLVDDPTSDGQITARTAQVLAQVQANFPRMANPLPAIAGLVLKATQRPTPIW